MNAGNNDLVVLMCNYGFRDITLNLITSIERHLLSGPGQNQDTSTSTTTWSSTTTTTTRQTFDQLWNQRFMLFALDDKSATFFKLKDINAINLSNRAVLNKCFKHAKTLLNYCDQCARCVCEDCHADAGIHQLLMETTSSSSSTMIAHHVSQQYNMAMKSMAKEAVERPMTSVGDMAAAMLTGGKVVSSDTVYGEQPESYGGVGFRAICNEKPLVVLDVLKRGYNVLWTDTDIVWLSDPFTAFQQAAYAAGIDYQRDIDLIIQQDDDDVCAGFYYIRSNATSISYMEQVIAFLNPIVDDQISMRKFLKELATPAVSGAPQTGKLRVFKLPRTTFPNGTAYFNLKLPQRANIEPVIIHNNCIIGHRSKRERFIDYGLWMIDDVRELAESSPVTGSASEKAATPPLERYKGHFDAVTALTTHGNTLYSTSLDKSIKQWSVVDAKLLKSKYVHKRGAVWGLHALSQDPGATPTLVTASHDKTAQCLDGETFNTLQTFTGHYGLINGLKIVEKLIVTFSDDKTIRVASINDQSFKRVFLGHSGWVSSVDHHGGWLFSSSSDTSIRQWDFQTGRCINIIWSQQGWVRSIIYSVAINRLISAGNDGSIKFWDLSNSNECTRTLYFEAVPVAIRQMLLDDQNDVLYVAGENGALKSYDINSGICIEEFEGHAPFAINCMHISAACGDLESRLYTGGMDKLIRSWPLSTNVHRHQQQQQSNANQVQP
ncbi:hypothetical protein SAMD00019534_118120 [Acytostelium subglobosum LB1]|uniref:hypothetical protein n=1 Tax=Acytostelium subglobosum LB1 TaxID=1410327 RepID=UPI000644DAAD|nr:hypothetical protein SAMD00019534_118120 [Acytostelium subglobosum LB1]GAM28636.1 hypothetical protein SAMD00019534_118120 [Acytostelium subglobosum LB1]|eukprot:XP_012748414.1 hypothetical protein SAMD00019534_118120 [Acytostelium subglobosum LB1]